MFGCLKTGLCAADPDEIDQLENYVLTWRVRGGGWNKPWKNHPDGYGLALDDDAKARLNTLNELRERIISPFVTLQAALKHAQTAGDCVRALYAFLEAEDTAGRMTDRAQAHEAAGRLFVTLQAALKHAQTAGDCVRALYAFLEAEDTAGRMTDRAQAHEAAGRLQLADEYRQLWEILVGAMEQTVWVCGDAPMTAARFSTLFHLVLSEYDVGAIPVSLDRVTCGAIDRVCSGQVKYLIVLGCNDGVLPKAPGPSAVLTETDRLALDGIGMTLSAFGAERMLMEQETIYKAIACPAKAPGPSAVLTETDRLALDGIGMTLSAFGAERMLMEQETIYKAIACPAEQLILSYHAAAADGSPCRPSYLIGAFRARLDGLTIQTADPDTDALEAPRLILSYHAAAADGSPCRPSYLIGAFRARLDGLTIQTADPDTDALEAPRPTAELACAALGDDRSPAACAALNHCADTELVRRAHRWSPARGPLHDREVIEGLYGKRLNLTASRVDKFYSCRFAFFMQYGLKAKQRKRADFAAPEAGTFIHFVLETVLQQLANEPGGVMAAEPRTIKKLLRAAVQTYIDDTLGGLFIHFVLETVLQQLANEPGGVMAAEPRTIKKLLRAAVQTYIDDTLGGLADKTARFQALFRRLVKSVETILNNVLDELRASDFVPIDYELDFSRGGDLPPVTVQDDDVTVSLSGKVDRVDGYIQNGRLYLRVMDYKSGKKSFSLSDVWNGLNMQLIIYLYALQTEGYLYALQTEGLERYRAKLTGELNEIRPAGVLYVPVRDTIPDGERAQDDETLHALRERALRRSGLLSDDIDILEAMEKGLTGEGKFLPVKLKVAKPTKKNPEPTPELAAVSSVADLEKFGRLARYTQTKLLEMGRELLAGDVSADPCVQGNLPQCQLSSVADLEKFGRLARYTQTKLLEMGRELLAGDVSADPCVQGNLPQCQFCDYRAACRFDESAGDQYRPLKKFKDSEVWDKLEGKDHDQVDK